MTDEELDQWRGREAWRLRHEYPEDATEVIAARFAREGRTPPEPVVDPDLLAFREWFAHLPGRLGTRGILAGRWDASDEAKAYLAGARMAREQERERAGKTITMAKELAATYRLFLQRLPLVFRAQLGVKCEVDEGFTKDVEAEIAKYRGEA